MILTNCRLVPELTEGINCDMADIRIEGNKIAEILPAGGSYMGEKVVDCSGMTVLPGLYNLHVHLYIDSFDWNVLPHRSQQLSFMQTYAYASKLLTYGYTTVRDVGNVYEHAIDLRNLINQGKLAGPNITASGYIITPNHNDILCAYTHLYTEPADGMIGVRKAVRRELAKGADFIKILGSPGNGASPYPLFDEEEMAELAKLVKEHHTYLAVHTTSPESNESAINAGAKTIEHGLFLTNDQVDRIAADPNMHIVLTETVNRLWDDPTTWIASRSGCAGVRNAYDAGVMIGFGTDADMNTFLSQPGEEFIDREVILGYDKTDVLKQATIHSAAIMDDLDNRGTIKVGKIADLAIFEGAPDKDFNIFNKPCEYVIKDGQIVARKGFVLA